MTENNLPKVVTWQQSVWPEVEPTTQRPNHYTFRPHNIAIQLPDIR